MVTLVNITLCLIIAFSSHSFAGTQEIDYDTLVVQAQSTPQKTESNLKQLLLTPDDLSPAGLVDVHLLLSQISFQQGRHQDSMRSAQRALALSKEGQLAKQFALAKVFIAHNLFEGHDYQMALRYLKEALPYFTDIDDQKMMANIYITIARSYSGLEQEQDALLAYLSSFQIILSHQRWNKLVGVYTGVSEPYLWIDDAIEQIDKVQHEIINSSPYKKTNSASRLIDNIAIWQFFTVLFFILVILAYWAFLQRKYQIDHLKKLTEAQQEHITTISTIGQEVTSSLELNTVAEYVYSHIKELFNADVFSIGIYNKNQNLIDFPFTIEKGKALEDYQIHMTDNERLAVWCIKNQKEVVLSQISDSSKYVTTEQTAAAGGMMQSIVYIPLMIEQNIVGCITVQREQEGSFNELQLNMMQTIASYTAIAVDNALTHQELKQASNTDYLTKLRNRRAFVEKAEYQLNVIERGKHDLCFAITDIDNFKQFNDTYGHDCGDYVLKEIAKTFISLIRKQDIVARWGGEEFVFMLPNTNLENAQFLLDKVRATIAAQHFSYQGHEFKISLTFGVTQAKPEAGLTKLMNTADEALYLGKQNGKNIVITKEYEALESLI